ncbi:MAG TPA: hypothetical protein PL193_17905, partial [Xanthobacteraceae bacterium]|nr:hypothetical protein [Xanthobacteraceae bacterium]
DLDLSFSMMPMEQVRGEAFDQAGEPVADARQPLQTMDRVVLLGEPGIAGRVRDTLIGTAETAVKKQNVYIACSGKRLGRAEVAPLYRACIHAVAQISELGPKTQVNPQILGMLMNMSFNNPEGYVGMFGPMLLCALEHDPTAICDADNRAMVVDGVNRYMRSFDRLLAGDIPSKSRSADDNLTLGQIQSLRDRIAFAVEKQVRDGRLIKSDFGWFPSAAITKIFAQVSPVRDACTIR